MNPGIVFFFLFVGALIAFLAWAQWCIRKDIEEDEKEDKR